MLKSFLGTLLIFSLFFLAGCNPAVLLSGNLAGQDVSSSQTAAQSQGEDIAEVAGQAQDSEQAQAKTNPSRTSVVAIPPAQAGQSVCARVYTPANPPKYVYLTFDDGPNTDFTGRILDILAEKQVKASFMVVGVNVEKNPELVRRMVAGGHAVINHTYTHNYKKIYASPEALLADLERASQVLEKILGHPVKIFRPPGGPGHLTRPFQKKLKENGYQSVGWNITGSDTDPRGVTPEEVFQSVANGLTKVEKLKLTPIVLLHDGTQLGTTEAPAGSALGKYVQSRESVIAALPRIIDLFQAKGYTFAVVDENTPPPW